MDKFDQTVDERLAVIRADVRAKEDLEIQALQRERLIIEPLAEKIRWRLQSRRLRLRIVPTPLSYSEFSKLAINIEHLGSKRLLGTIIVRSFNSGTADSTASEDTVVKAYFFEIENDEYVEEELVPAEFELEEIPDYQLDESAFVEKLVECLISLTVLVERDEIG